MLLTAPVRQQHRLMHHPVEEEAMRRNPNLCRRVNTPRSSVPAITHVDYSARVQTVDVDRNPRFHRLLQAFFRLTGCPMLVNTSFNVRGEPIVCTPQDAWRCFLATDMDILVLDYCLVDKQRLRSATANDRREEYLESFALD
jgi:carbamoyltransferase